MKIPVFISLCPKCEKITMGTGVTEKCNCDAPNWSDIPTRKELEAQRAELRAENDRLQAAWMRYETIQPDGELGVNIQDVLKALETAEHEAQRFQGEREAAIQDAADKQAIIDEQHRELADKDAEIIKWIEQQSSDERRAETYYKERNKARRELAEASRELDEYSRKVCRERRRHADMLKERDEARRWARKMRDERDEALAECTELDHDLTAIQWLLPYAHYYGTFIILEDDTPTGVTG